MTELQVNVEMSPALTVTVEQGDGPPIPVAIPPTPLVVEIEKPGPAGKSAYEIALEEGFVGTPEEWLQSLTGPPGDEGPPGTGDKHYHHIQNIAADTWPVNHNLGKIPADPVVKDSANNFMEVGVTHPDLNNSIITLAEVTSGEAWFN